jgi:DNA-binding transcriptional LysR family regulator
MLSRHLPTTRALQCFLAVAQELNFRSAAALLNMSQPPLSRQIQALEDLLRVQLIARDTHHVSLTPAGAAFHQEVHAYLKALDSATADLAHRFDGNRDGAASVRIGLTSAIHYQAIARLDDLMGRPGFTGARPVLRAISRKLIEQVRQGALDIAIVGDIIAPSDDLRVEWIGSEPMMAMLPARHPAAAQDTVSLADLGALPLFWFARTDNPAFYDKCGRVFRQHGYAAPRRLEPKDFTMLLAAVAAGEGVALCPQSMQATSRTGVVYRALAAELAPLLAIDMQVVWRSGETRAAVLDKVALIRPPSAVTR